MDWLGIGRRIRSQAGVDARRDRARRWPSCGRSSSSARDRREAPRRRAARPRRRVAGRPGRTRLGAGARPGRTPESAARPRPAPMPARRGATGATAGAAAVGAAAAVRRCRPGRARPGLRRARRRRLVPGAARRAARSARTGARCSPASAAAGSTGWTCGCSSSWWSAASCSGRSASPSRTRCTSTRSTTPGPPPSSSRTGATACRTTSTSGPTRTWPSTRWPPGIVLWGEDHVGATSDLGVTGPGRGHRAAPGRPAAPGGRAGERLHVATGSEIRTYDLRTRDLISVVPAAPAPARWPSIRPATG